jgi:hypothetical protein
VAIFDFDNDGHQDIFFTNGADIRTLKKTSPKYSNRLFRNKGQGNFEDVTEKAGLAGSGFDNGVAIADYDNDGFRDIFVGGVHRNTLYRNNGNGTFTDVTQRAGLAATQDRQYGPLWSVGAVWADFNNDGWLDLFILNYLAWSPHSEPACDYRGRPEYCHPRFYKPLPNQLFLSSGNGMFRDVSAEWGIRDHPGKAMGAAAADYNLDGLIDIFVANDKLYNWLFLNQRGRFTEAAFTANVAVTEDGTVISGMGADGRDLDNDGLPDIVVVALDDETFPVFRNTGKGEFIDITKSTGIAQLSLPMAGYSPMAVDFDNDGWKDIFVSRGHVQSLQAAPRIHVEQHSSVFRNLGGKTFHALTNEAGFDRQPPRRHRGSAAGDLNNDGRVDLVVTAIGAPAEIWINDSPAENHWLALQLEGKKSNRDGIGARIRVVSQAGAQYDQVSWTSGYASSSAGPVHFGLGPDKQADAIEIVWPSGRTQRLSNVPGDQVLKVREP